MLKNFIVFAFCLMLFPFCGNSQGIGFNSNNNLISERTSYNVFAHNTPKFGEGFSVSFDLSVSDPLSFGYIFSVKDKNKSTSYSLSYINASDGFGKIKFNLDAVKNILSIPLDTVLIGSKKWVKVQLIFNSESQSITLTVNGKTFTENTYGFDASFIPEMYFGKHGSVIEVPDMAIKNLLIKNGNREYNFHLNESQGKNVHDTNGKLYGHIDNPNWLINESYHWKKRYSFSSNQVASISFDEAQQRFVIFNSDSLSFYHLRNETTQTQRFANPIPVPMRLGTSFIDTATNTLYVYEVNDVPNNKATIASANLDSLIWVAKSTLQLPTQRHHHNFYLDSDKDEFLIFGGFGNQRLTNNFDVYNFNSNTWKSLVFSGDTITPRYFSGLTQINKDELLIFGGLGNKTGDQSIGKTYYYDCYKVNLNTKIIIKLWNVKRDTIKMVTSRSLVVTNDTSAFYTLGYPEYIANTHLQLYEYTIAKGTYRVLGDSIPMISERIRTNANLYFNKETNELFCTTQEFELDGSNRISIYSINAPPVSKETINDHLSKANTFNYFLWGIILGVLLLFALVYAFIKYRKRKKKALEIQIENTLILDEENTKTIKPMNSVSLFGNFSVADRKGKDITYLFSPKIRQLFLLLLFNSYREDYPGVSSESIYSKLWPDSPVQKAKNLKNVTISQLRKILNAVNGLEVIYTHGRFFIEFNEGFHCDYFKVLDQLNLLKKDIVNNEALIELTQLTKSGGFLKSIDDECFDQIKKDYEFQTLKLIPNHIKRLYKNKNYAAVIPVTKILFNIYSLNEVAFYYKLHALLKMGLKDKAKSHFNYFIIDYKKMMGDDFTYTFNEVSKRIPKGLIRN
ncbi:galactose oxidase-like protein [Flavobacteriaceae bacterium MAR_2010_72]|nr:galactose oxidase-like protein [Flavobacteriaceae bacterium MAR_2010_72]